MTHLVAVFGASPGIGKSTIARDLAADAGPTVRIDLFREDEVLSRPEFATVADQFRATGRVDLEVLLEASAAFAASSRAFDIVITDALFPFTPSLVAWGHDESAIRAFFHRLLAILVPLHPVVVYLDGEPEAALRRAAGRSGDEWMTWFVTKVGTYEVEPRVLDLEGAVAHLRRERDLTITLLRETGWEVVVLHDADTRDTGDLVAEAHQRLNQMRTARG